MKDKFDIAKDIEHILGMPECLPPFKPGGSSRILHWIVRPEDFDNLLEYVWDLIGEVKRDKK